MPPCGCQGKKTATGSPSWTFTHQDGTTVQGTEAQARAAQINAAKSGESGTLAPSR